ncbi:Concanavalin A-like lectin/glucanase domain [Phytophthora cactorum]|nr:Concanavalin A-like lectin/glucanase domain [Phytophthora cactorum]
MLRLWTASSVLWLAVGHRGWAARTSRRTDNQLVTQSGLKMWVDPDTPQERYTWETSRGDTWDLVMSDEFNTPGRSFRPGDDHMWTSIEKPDGVNDAMEVYAHNQTTTACDEAIDVCSFQIELEDSVSSCKSGTATSKRQASRTSRSHTISSSIQVGPGMPPDFRVIPPLDDNKLCIYSSSCATPGANVPGIPESVYLGARGHQSWYQNLRYAANNFCHQNASQVQSYATVEAALSAGIEDNVCSVTTCPASLDINSDLDYMSDEGGDRWGINSNGTCFSAMNSYMGEYICSAGNPDPGCKPLDDAPVLPQDESTFAFQMDALSANWPVHMAAYIDFVEYQVEWVPGPNGYVRWMLSGDPLYEIPAKTITEPPQGASVKNPSKIMIEEPMYLIFNVAMSSKWGAQPPNPKNPCRGDGLDPVANAICDSFPMYLKIDYIRVYQDLSSDSIMSVGCDPATHPTRQWILDHLDEYEDEENKLVEVRGKAFCRTDADCTVQTAHRRSRNSSEWFSNRRSTVVLTGRCVSQRCECSSKSGRTTLYRAHQVKRGIFWSTYGSDGITQGQAAATTAIRTHATPVESASPKRLVVGVIQHARPTRHELD